MQLTILGTSDLHGNLWGWRYETGRETPNDGMARVYAYVQQVRAENPNTLLLDAGDVLQGTILTDDLYNKMPDTPHPMMAAMNFMGYDALTLGNHEFNWGIPTLKTILGQAEFPILAANVRDKQGNLLTGKGWRIVECGGIRVAVIGVVTPDVPLWDGEKEGVADYIFEPAPEAVRKAIRQIGTAADLFVVSAHMGMYAEFDEENGSDSAQKILDENPEVVVLQAAHDHVIVREKQGRTVLAEVRSGGRDVARFDLTLDESGNVLESRVEIVDMAGITPSEALRALPLVAEGHQKTLEFMEHGGRKTGEQGSVLGSTTAPFRVENEIRALPEVLFRDTALPELINRVQRENAAADVSSTSLFGLDGSLPGGEVCYSDLFKIYPFDNILYRVRVTGAELKSYMEWSASAYRQWQPGDINLCFDPDTPYFMYDIFDGVEYEIDLSQPRGQRIRNVRFQGRPLENSDTLTLAVNNYRYAAVLKGNKLVAAKKEWVSSGSVREMLVEYFRKHSPVEPVVDHNWKIVGVDLSRKDPRREMLVQKINEELLEMDYQKCYNLKEYEELLRKKGMA